MAATSSPPLKNNRVSLAMERTGQWVFSQEIPTDVVVAVGEANFSLHKFMLIAKSNYIRKLVIDSKNGDLKNMDLSDIPGGPEIFEKAAKFCYGVNFEITVDNVAALRCAAEYLQMTDKYCDNNLAGRTEDFLTQVALTSLSGGLVVLKSCEDLLPLADDLNIVRRCVDVISSKCRDLLWQRSWPDLLILQMNLILLRTQSRSDPELRHLRFRGRKIRKQKSPLVDKTRSSSAVRNIPGFGNLRDEVEMEIGVGTQSTDLEGHKRKSPPHTQNVLKTMVEQQARDAKRAKVQGSHSSLGRPDDLEDVGELAIMTGEDLAKRLKCCLHAATQVSKEMSKRVKKPVEGVEVMEKTIKKLEDRIDVIQGQFDFQKTVASDKTRELEDLTKKMSEADDERKRTEEELRSKISTLEEAATHFDVEMGSLQEQSERQKAALLRVPEQLEEARVEAVKTFRAAESTEKDICVIMGAAISAGYTMAINDCRARDSTFDPAGLKNILSLNPGAIPLFEKYFSEFQAGVDLDALYGEGRSGSAVQGAGKGDGVALEAPVSGTNASSDNPA